MKTFINLMTQELLKRNIAIYGIDNDNGMIDAKQMTPNGIRTFLVMFVGESNTVENFLSNDAWGAHHLAWGVYHFAVSVHYSYIDQNQLMVKTNGYVAKTSDLSLAMDGIMQSLERKTNDLV